MKYKRAFPLLVDLSPVQCKEKYEILKVKMDTSMQKKKGGALRNFCLRSSEGKWGFMLLNNFSLR